MTRYVLNAEGDWIVQREQQELFSDQQWEKFYGPFTNSGIMEAGELLMLNTSEWPSAAEGSSVSSLSQILEPDVARKYCLSTKVCAGILRRAEKRGKTLPEHLEAALKAAASAPPI